MTKVTQVWNAPLDSYWPEVEEQDEGTVRQVVKVGEMPATTELYLSSMVESAVATENLLRYGEQMAWGDGGPLQQHEKESAGYPAQELLTFDTGLHRILGSERLVSDDNQRLKVETRNAQVLRVEGRMTRASDTIPINLEGRTSVAVQLFGTWAGTVSFQATSNGQDWLAWACRANVSATVTSSAISSTTSGIWQANVSGLRAFRVAFSTATSGMVQVVLTAVDDPIAHQAAIATYNYGTQTSLHMQRPTTLEQATHDSALREALYIAEPYNSNIIYYPGDVVTWRDRVYRCILQTTVSATVSSPLSTTYWVADPRVSRSLITSEYTSAPNAARLRIEHDLDAYQYRLQEMQAVTQRLQIQNDMITDDYTLTISQDYGGQSGKRFAQGQSGMSKYIFEEFR